MKPPDSSASPFPVANPAQTEIQSVFRRAAISSLPARPAQNPLQKKELVKESGGGGLPRGGPRFHE